MEDLNQDHILNFVATRFDLVLILNWLPHYEQSENLHTNMQASMISTPNKKTNHKLT